MARGANLYRDETKETRGPLGAMMREQADTGGGGRCSHEYAVLSISCIEMAISGKVSSAVRRVVTAYARVFFFFSPSEFLPRYRPELLRRSTCTCALFPVRPAGVGCFERCQHGAHYAPKDDSGAKPRTVPLNFSAFIFLPAGLLEATCGIRKEPRKVTKYETMS